MSDTRSVLQSGLRVQYPILGRRTPGFDVRSKWITAIYDEIRRTIPSELLRLFFVPVSAATGWSYRLQMRLLERPDAVTHVTTQMQSFLLRRRPRAPTVITCYDLTVPWTLERLPFADRVIVAARDVGRQLSEAVRLPHDPEVIPLAVPPTYAPANLPRTTGQILFVGTEQPRKNVEGLFRIFARVARQTPVTLVKVGARSSARPRLEALARELGIDGRLVWKDFVSEGDLVRLYQTSALTVVPSFVEGFSMPCLEAMAAGCPLIASNLSAIPETVGSGGLLIDPRDEDAWVEGILRSLGDAAVARELSSRGLRRSTAFSARASAAETLRVYREVWDDRGHA